MLSNHSRDLAPDELEQLVRDVAARPDRWRHLVNHRPDERTAAAGEAFTFGPADIHRVSHAGAEPAITVHAYSPPLWRMGAYEVLPTGELRRWSLSYAEELRPIGA